jgi:hypothetical protein
MVGNWALCASRITLAAIVIKKIWNDPVWSKVIAASIIGAAGLAYSTKWWPVWISQRLAGLWRYSWAYSLSPSGAPHWLLILLILLAVPTIILAAAMTWTLGFPRKNVASRAVQSSREIPYTSDSFEGLRWRWQCAGGEITDLCSSVRPAIFRYIPRVRLMV